MEISDKFLLKVSVCIVLIGLVGLFVLSLVIEYPEYGKDEIKNSDTVYLKGTITDKKVGKYSTIYSIDHECNTKVNIENSEFEINDDIKIIGQIYNEKLYAIKAK